MLLVTRKKYFYDYEKEIRFWYRSTDEQPVGKPIDIDPHKLIDKIIVSPYMPKWNFNSMIKILKKFGYSIPIAESLIKDTMLK
jgi:hypothetical protein